MKSYRHLLVLILLSISAYAQEQSSAGPPAPKMVVASLEHDFGKVKEGTPLTIDFNFRNEGNADLIVESVAPS